MTELAKWVWIVLIVVLCFGANIIWFVLAEVILILLIWWLKPEWPETRCLPGKGRRNARTRHLHQEREENHWELYTC